MSETVKKRKKCQDLVGKRYERLEIVKFVGYGGDYKNERMWEAICDCGNTIQLSTHRFKRGKTRSCGCLHRERASARAKLMKHRLPEGEASFNQLLRSYKISAEKRKLSFEISDDKFKELTKTNCHYCNKEPSNLMYLKVKNGNYMYNGVDRKDPKIGYTEDNVVSCCSNCNFGKQSLTYTEFKEWIESVYSYFIKEKSEDTN
jgi:hypothetical protein